MTGWLVQTLVSSTLLAAIVLMLRGPVSRQFGARIAYALWWLPALRMILPPLPGWRQLYVPVVILDRHDSMVGLVPPVRLIQAIHDHARVALPDLAALPALPALPAPAMQQTHALPWGMILLAVWLGGAALWFGWQMLAYRHFLSGALAKARPLSRECGIDVLISESVDGPVAAGIWRRRIILPADFMQRYAPDERRLALVHEAAHHDRLDIPANLFAMAMLSLHWWNPLAHRAYRAFRADQELACDATVLAGAAPRDRHAYGSAILKSASGRLKSASGVMPAVACALSHKAEIRQRIGMMARRPVGLGRMLAGGTLALAAVAGGLLVTASGNASVAPMQAMPMIDAAAIRSATHNAAIAAHEAENEARIAEHEARAAGLHASRTAHVAMLRAQAAGDRAQRAGERAAAATGRAQAESVRADGIAQAALAQTRAKMAERCSAKGVTISTDAEWGRLATCGLVPFALSTARAAVSASHDMAQAQRTQALAEIDKAMADVDREMAKIPAN